MDMGYLGVLGLLSSGLTRVGSQPAVNPPIPQYLNPSIPEFLNPLLWLSGCTAEKPGLCVDLD